MSRELDFNEVMDYLRSTAFDQSDCLEIINTVLESTEYHRRIELEERVLELEELCAKMDKYIESQYSKYKEAF